ncbi:MAG TPA: TRAP transporter large permease subunit, partial [Gaiellaceae bacterium]|nr:TRAP transporter large permease subunit [Gaiellaceae bacterium]
ANDLLTLAGGNALLLLAMTAITSLVLGLGLTTTACYIFLAILVGPALEKVGLNKMAVHMFVFYWGMLSSITPPVSSGTLSLRCSGDGRRRPRIARPPGRVGHAAA